MDLDRKVQLYLTKLQEGGGAITTYIVIAATRGLLLACNRNMLVEYGGHVHLNRYWAQGLLKRIGFVKKKGTTLKSKHSVSSFKEIKTQFLQEIVEMEDVYMWY